MKNRSSKSLHEWLRPTDFLRFLIMSLMLTVPSTRASAQVVLQQGDILVAEPGTASISVIDPATGTKTIIAQGGLLSPPNKAVGVALAADGDVIVVSRLAGLIRVNPATGDQSILSEGGLFRDPWALVINRVTGDIYVADSGYDNDRPEINGAGKIIRVNPVTGAQELIATGTACTLFPPNAACQNTTSAGSYLTHPYGIALDYSTSPATIVVSDMSSFNGKGAIVRIQPVPNGAQALLWGPASAVPAPEVAQVSPLGCPMGIEVEPNGNILTTVFTYPVPASPTFPPPGGTFYGCAPPGIYRVDLINNVQSVVNANAPRWQAAHAYVVGNVIFDDAPTPHVHRVVTAGTSQSSNPPWNGTLGGVTTDGTVVWQNIGLGANWLIPFGVNVEPAPTQSNPSNYNIIVGDEGYSMVFRLAANGAFIDPVPLTTNTSNVTSVDVIEAAPGGSNSPPVRSNGQPAGTLPSATTQTTLSLATNENATCRFSPLAGTPYESMANTFSTTGTTSHSTLVNGLTSGTFYTFYVRCVDPEGNANLDDFIIAFTVASSSSTISNFSGTESPLSEGGMWDSPGAWADLQKNGGAFAVAVNAMARLVTPGVGPDQYSEITYDQDPGDESWAGVATRVQSASNGSNYLAIAYAGEVRLYRTDDVGSLNFTPLASAPADIGAAPRRLRLESQGNNHRVYFNGTLMFNHTATAPLYSSGQPGIAASVFPGPQVKILSFEGGDLTAGPVPSLTISDVSVTEGNAGSVTATLTVSLSAASTQAISVNYATANGTATAGSDYTGGSGTLTFAPGQTSQPINLSVTGDTLDEANETFTVNLSAPSNATILDGQGVVTILDDDPAPTISITDVTVPEGNSGSANAVLTVSLSVASGQTVTVAYATANGTATAGSDYTSGSGTLTFAPGEISKLVTIGITGDVADEVNETFTVNLTAPSNATILDGQGIVTITDDDGLPSISVADISVVEGNSGTKVATFTLTLSTSSGSPVTVRFATANGTASSSSDYVARATTTATFPSGTTSVPVTVTINGDTLYEANETFVLNLTVPTNATIADPQATATITNDDAPGTLSIGNRTVTEGNTGSVNANFTVTLSPSSGTTITVAYATANGTASAGTDYVATTGTLSFSPGATSRTITVPVTGDLLDEANETFFVNLSAPGNATIGDGEGLGTINDNDALPSISIADLSVLEGNSGTSVATFTLTLSAMSGRQVSVAYATANGAATAGSDYVGAAGTAIFPVGTTSVPVEVTINGDTATEANEGFAVGLSGAINATIARAQATGVILNDDGGTPQPTGLVAAYGFAEGAGETTADASGGGQTGAISGATWATDGKTGNALAFDGVDDMVTIADNAALDVTRITMMAWVRPSALSGWRTVLLKERPLGLAYGLYADNDAQRPAGHIVTGSLLPIEYNSAGVAPLPVDSWSHLAATYDGSRLRLYVNGVLVRTTTVSGNIVTSGMPLRIGGNEVWGEWFAGVIDDVRIYNRALSQTEIAVDMNTPITP